MDKDIHLHYKLRDLKVFSSTEWLANNEKKYRTVYDELECGFIYCELSFYNKLFDETDWEIELSLKCVNISSGIEICKLQVARPIQKDENIVYIREGWGVKFPGKFWEKGIYRWEAWIAGTLVAEKVFYIIDLGLVTETVNPYFELKSVKLYEGPGKNLPHQEREFLYSFDASNTRYVWLEIFAKNNISSSNPWPLEVQYYFMTKTGQLKGMVESLNFIDHTQEKIELNAGWGSDTLGTWTEDHYNILVVFMDHVIAVVPFEIGSEPIREENIPIVKTEVKTTELVKVEPVPQSIEDVLVELDALIGLEGIKKKIREYTTYLNFIQLRKEKGFSDIDKIQLHAVFTGNPGTGKTTVAKMLGQIYTQLGLLSKGHVIEADRSDLVAEFIGQTAPKTKEIIKKAKGGILLVDEAYALSRKNDDSKDFGKEAVEILLKEMSDGDGDIAIIVAGYPNEMEDFLASNPGLKSRFTMFYEFPDYIPQELMRIAQYCAQKRGVVFSDDAAQVMNKKLVDAYRDRDKMFGNARYVNSLIDESKMNMGLRIMQTKDPKSLTKEEISTIEPIDIEKIFKRNTQNIADIPIDEELLKQALNTLHHLIGLDKVKTEIDELVKLVRFYREIGKDVRQSFSLHAVFTGNPGTGKTTVARILAQIYKALGILERGNLVECDRQSLVGGFVGQTAIKTNELLQKAMGGVLFIDEAYALSEGGENDYGKEAVETILKKMEDSRGQLIVIVAGYTANMKRFLESNPGLKSRFDREMHFDDYNTAQLFDIGIKMLAGNSIQANHDAAEHLKVYFDSIHSQKDQYFGNARTVRKIVEEVIKNQHLRLAKLEPSERTKEMIGELTLADVLEFVPLKSETENKKTIGFKQS
jgi:SpoVK/Ycf46/Vps4 family AAA+-type ATPase